ncbi:hypothetical protein C8Q70DRAFT_685277 [Cubamyces menziesii]|nr:hypothetical protein C8Q70DRAFT_685277 [Cubamyces menziesii]
MTGRSSHVAFDFFQCSPRGFPGFVWRTCRTWWVEVSLGARRATRKRRVHLLRAAALPFTALRACARVDGVRVRPPRSVTASLPHVYKATDLRRAAGISIVQPSSPSSRHHAGKREISEPLTHGIRENVEHRSLDMAMSYAPSSPLRRRRHENLAVQTCCDIRRRCHVSLDVQDEKKKHTAQVRVDISVLTMPRHSLPA